jgi:hypothetical protein
MPQLGAITKQYVSSIDFLDQREILNKILDITNEEFSFMDIMELTGRSKPTSVPEYHHFVNEEMYVLGTVSAVTGSASPLLTATIDVPAWGNVNVGELVLFPDGRVGYVVSKAATSNIVIRSIDGTNLTLVATNRISFFSNAAGEGSLSPAAKRYGIAKFFNQVQIFKSKFEVTDVQKASKVEVDFQGKPYYMYKGQHDALLKFRDDIAAAMMFGRRSTTKFSDASPTLVDAELKPIQTTMGLDQYITTLGSDLSLLTAGTLALADVKALIQLLNRNRSPKEYFLFVGTTQNILWDDVFNNLGNAGITAGAGVSGAARFQIQGRDIELGIDKIKIYGTTFYKKHLPILDHKNIINFTGGYNAKDAAYGVPYTKVKTVDGGQEDRMQVRYMLEGNTDFKYREIVLGGLAPTPTNERSVLELHYSSIQGLELLDAQNCFKLK